LPGWPGWTPTTPKVRTLEEVREMARDLITLALDVDEAEVGPIEVTENDWR
jgi:hypothetical protein